MNNTEIRDWVIANMPSGTVIGNPEWWADRIAALASQASKGAGVPEGGAIGSNGTIYYGIAEMARHAESVEALHMWLDEQGVERADNDAEFSPVGRVMRLLAQQACTGQIEDAIEAAFWEADARRKGYGEWKTRPQSERDAFKWAVRACVGKVLPAAQAQPASLTPSSKEPK